jgi:hypothetical protein
MRRPIASRARLKSSSTTASKLMAASKKILPHAHLLVDASRTSLLALKESADAFPPLKAAVGGVLAVWDVAEAS